ncbi:hypothetical protein L1987_57308 [Smallanthus sonchifolius]|uniref:Uncharacterized protein n=1 Tax=Smallanthus sonchifolius TaxID=185202 RepID=A0ACB9DCP3_9ASTR|nr:hypothetical protein L1987_57308 [Smallanthus sonchifolius]
MADVRVSYVYVLLSNVVEDTQVKFDMQPCSNVVDAYLCEIILTTRDASVAVGGLSWTVTLGRRDSTNANRGLADSDLPRADQDLASLIRGSHTIGQSRCVAFRARIYSNGSDIDANFACTRRRNCPANRGDGDGNLAPLDLVTPNSFDNNYFRNLVQRRGLLQSDQVLFSGGSSDSIVLEYSNNPRRFASDFAAAMVKMGEIEPLTGASGVLRTTCSVAN